MQRQKAADQADKYKSNIQPPDNQSPVPASQRVDGAGDDAGTFMRMPLPTIPFFVAMAMPVCCGRNNSAG